MTTHSEILKAIYTEERSLWLDPEDAQAMAQDVLDHLDKIGHLRRPAFKKSVGNSTVALDSLDDKAESGFLSGRVRVQSPPEGMEPCPTCGYGINMVCSDGYHYVYEDLLAVHYLKQAAVKHGGLAGGSCRSPEV